MAGQGWETIGDSSMGSEVDSWKTRALAAEQELQEHQETSAELEAELERELQEKEEQLRKWQTKYRQLEVESRNTNERLQSSLTETHTTVEKLRSVNKSLEHSTTEQSETIRKLEQNTDDQERREREAGATISNLENSLAEQIQRCELLEAQLEEKEQVEAECQRLRDRTKDLDQDLAIERSKESRIKKLLASPKIAMNQRRRGSSSTTESAAPPLNSPRAVISQSASATAALSTPRVIEKSAVVTNMLFNSPKSSQMQRSSTNSSPLPAGPLPCAPMPSAKVAGGTGDSPSSSSSNTNTSENSVNVAVTPKRKAKVGLMGGNPEETGFRTPQNKKFGRSNTLNSSTPSNDHLKQRLFQTESQPSPKKTPFLKRVFGLGRTKCTRRNKSGSGLSATSGDETPSQTFHTPALRVSDLKQ